MNEEYRVISLDHNGQPEVCVGTYTKLDAALDHRDAIRANGGECRTEVAIWRPFDTWPFRSRFRPASGDDTKEGE